MSFTIQQTKVHLTGMLHGGTLNKVRNIEALMERAQNTMLARIDPLETMRIAPLAQTVHDQLYNYSLASDYKKLIDLLPEANRTTLDRALRVFAEPFDFQKAVRDKQVSIEGSEGTKIIRINWRVRSPKLLNSMDSYNGNGTWSAVGTASNIKTDTIYKYSGGGSVEFDIAASGDGIQNTGMTQIDMTNENQLADVIMPIYLSDATKITSVTAIWGNDLTTKFWTATAQTTQADGTAFKNGWNILKFPWSTATQTGTVDKTKIDSFKLTFAATGALTQIRADNIMFAIGYPFDMKYYSKFIFKNTSGTWISQPTSDDDTVVLDNDSYNIFLFQCLEYAAHQMEGRDGQFDLDFAQAQLNGDPKSISIDGRIGLYRKYAAQYPSQAKIAVAQYAALPRFQRPYRTRPW